MAMACDTASSELPPLGFSACLEKNALAYPSAKLMVVFAGSVTSPTRLDCSIPRDRKITTDFGLYRIHRQMYSSSASPSRHRHRSRTSARNGSPRSITTVPACPA